MTGEKVLFHTPSMTEKEATIKKEERRLLGFIRSRVSTLEDAEDIFQDVLVQFIDGYGAMGSIEKATSWLFKVASNKIIDLYRYRKVRSNQVEWVENPEEDGPILLRDILPDLGQSPEEIYFRNLIWDSLMDALDDLPELQKDVFMLHELEGMSFKEIAVLLNEPVNTLISRKRYAVLTLRKKLQKFYKEIGS